MLLPLLLPLLLLAPSASATTLTFQLDAAEKACFYAQAESAGQKISFYFAVQSGGSFDVDYTVTDPRNAVIQTGQKEKQGDFVFSATMPGEYAFCFSNQMSTYTTKMIDFDITVQNDRSGVKAEFPTADNAKALTPLESSLYKLSGWLSDISRNQKYIRTREHRSFETVQSTESRIFWFGLMESALIVGMAVLQVFVVKAFFQGAPKGRI